MITGPRKLVAQHIAEAALTVMGDTMPMATMRKHARRLARRTIMHLERQGFRPADFHSSAANLDALGPVVVALSADTAFEPEQFCTPFEPEQFSKYALESGPETPTNYLVQTLPWKWTTLIVIRLVTKAVLTIRNGRCALMSWGDEDENANENRT